MEPPRKQIKVIIEAQAHDWDDLAYGLENLATQILMGRWRSPGTGYSAGATSFIITKDLDPDAPSEEEYNAQLREYARGLALEKELANAKWEE